MRGWGWLSLLAYLLFVHQAAAQCAGLTKSPVPFATETLTIGATPQALTPAKYKPSGTVATMAMVTVESGDIRYQVVGTPTPTDGHYVGALPPQTFAICGIETITAFKAVRVSVDSRATVTYYKAASP